MNKVWFHSLTSGNVFHVIVTWLMAGNNDWVPSESELSDQSSSLWTLVERRTSIRGGGRGEAPTVWQLLGEGTCWRGRGLMNTGEWLSYGSGPAGKIRGLVLILNETLLLFIEGVTRSSTYLYPSFYLSAQYSFLRSEWLLVAESGRHSSCSCLQ